MCMFCLENRNQYISVFMVTFFWFSHENNTLQAVKKTRISGMDLQGN